MVVHHWSDDGMVRHHRRSLAVSFSYGKQYSSEISIPALCCITGQYGGKLRHEISPWCGMVLVLELELVLDLVSENLC